MGVTAKTSSAQPYRYSLYLERIIALRDIARHDAHTPHHADKDRAETAIRERALGAEQRYVENIIANIPVQPRTRLAWCSHCMQRTIHLKARGRAFHKSAYMCSSCGIPTTPCLAIGCREMAMRPHGPGSYIAYCAEHQHEVTSFEDSPVVLHDIADYRNHLHYAKVNKGQLNQHLILITTFTAAGIAGGIVAAPAIGRAMGMRLRGLEGTAATKEGLAMLGNWAHATRQISQDTVRTLREVWRELPKAPAAKLPVPKLPVPRLSSQLITRLRHEPPKWLVLVWERVASLITAERLNIARGTALIATIGGAIGAAYGTRFLSGYIDDDKSFDVIKLRDGSGPAVIVVQGFTSQNREDSTREELFAEQIYDDPTIYRVTWGAQNATRLGLFLGKFPTTYVGSWQIKRLVEIATQAAGLSIGSMGALTVGSSLLNNPWHVAVSKAARAGDRLASILRHSDRNDWVMVANSLGARVLVDAALALGEDAGGSPRPRLAELHLLGAAVDSSGYGTRMTNGLTDAVSGAIHNYFSTKDAILRYLYPVTRLGARAAGYVGFETADPKVVNHDVTDLVDNHFAYFRVLNRVFGERAGFR